MTSEEQSKVDEAADELAGFIDEFRAMIETLAPDERMILWNRMLMGYCPLCGDETHGRVCECDSAKFYDNDR